MITWDSYNRRRTFSSETGALQHAQHAQQPTSQIPKAVLVTDRTDAFTKKPSLESFTASSVSQHVTVSCLLSIQTSIPQV